MKMRHIIQARYDALEQQLVVAVAKQAKLRHPTTIFAYNQQCQFIDKLRREQQQCLRGLTEVQETNWNNNSLNEKEHNVSIKS